MEKDRTVLLCVHPQLLHARADFFDDYFGGIGLNNPAIAAKQIKEEPIRYCSAVRNTPSLDPRNASVGELPAEFGEEPRLADAGLADDADCLAVTIFDQLKEIVQDGTLALAVDKSCRVSGRQLAQPSATMGDTQQAIRRDRLIFAPEGE